MDTLVTRKTRGSRLIFGAVTFLDIVLANLLYWFLEETDFLTLPDEMHELSVGLMLTTLSAMFTAMFYGTIIDSRRISLLDVIVRTGKFSFMLSICQLAMGRLQTDNAAGLLRYAFVYFILYYLLLMFVRCVERQILNQFRKAGHNSRTVLFVGSDPANLLLYNTMKTDAFVGYRILGYYSNNPIEGASEELRRLGTRDELVQMVENDTLMFVPDEIYCCLSKQDDADINAIIHFCDRNVVQFYLVPRIYGNLSLNLTSVLFGEYTLFTNHTNSINRLDNRIVKRLFDIVFSSIVCLFICLIIPIIWVIVKIQSPGPLFFKQERTGHNGESFMCYKFRSMHVNSDADRVQATKNDPRKFPFGEFMRKTNIDELPQFFNVLKGDMSIVGPRPHMLLHTEQYSAVIDKYMVRHFSKPGITGWAQVTGYRGETREVWQMEERVKRDIWYNENWSFMLDLEIIIRTAKSIIKPDKNAY